MVARGRYACFYHSGGDEFVEAEVSRPWSRGRRWKWDTNLFEFLIVFADATIIQLLLFFRIQRPSLRLIASIIISSMRRDRRLKQ